MKTPDQVTAMAVRLLTAVGAGDQSGIDRTAEASAALHASLEVHDEGPDERTELLAAVARSAQERSRGGSAGLEPAEFLLLAHLAA